LRTTTIQTPVNSFINTSTYSTISTLRFGEKTTNRRTTTSSYQIKKEENTNRSFENKLDETNTSTFPNEIEDVTTIQYNSLNIDIALTNLNMTVDDLKEKKEDQLASLSTIFGKISDENGSPKTTKVIYGDIKKKNTSKQYISTDFGKDSRYRVGWNNPWYRNGGSMDESLITNRKTSTTTREPITYFDINGVHSDESLNILSQHEQDLLHDFKVIDYYYEDPYEDYNVYEVPTGVKSALIASSVVGGLAVSIFLFIFMLCLWKQMKNKLRMSTEYEECSKQGIFTNILSKATKNNKQKTKKEANGYFNKVSPNVSQHWQKNNDSTSSEEY